MLSKWLTKRAIDSLKEMVRTADLNEDQIPDVDQLRPPIGQLVAAGRSAYGSCDWVKIAKGIELVVAGVQMIISAIDYQSIKQDVALIGQSAQQIGALIAPIVARCAAQDEEIEGQDNA